MIVLLCVDGDSSRKTCREPSKDEVEERGVASGTRRVHAVILAVAAAIQVPVYLFIMLKVTK